MTVCMCAVGTQAERIPVAKRLSLANCQLPGQVNYLAKTINRGSERDGWIGIETRFGKQLQVFRELDVI